jgi:hypothetical protein
MHHTQGVVMKSGFFAGARVRTKFVAPETDQRDSQDPNDTLGLPRIDRQRRGDKSVAA